MRLSGAKATRSEIIMAAVVDRLSYILWLQTEDGRNGVNKPDSMVGVLLGSKKEESNVTSFDTPEEYSAAWARITGGGT